MVEIKTLFILLKQISSLDIVKYYGLKLFSEIEFSWEILGMFLKEMFWHFQCIMKLFSCLDFEYFGIELE